MAVVNVTGEFEAWLGALGRGDQKAVLQVVKLLQAAGIGR